MAPKAVSNEALAKELTEAVRHIWKTGDKAALTVNAVRQRVEQKPKLEDGFLKEGEMEGEKQEDYHRHGCKAFFRNPGGLQTLLTVTLPG